MKIGIACGGTGGHIFPGLATAQVLRERGHEVTLWMGGKDIEKKALSGWNGPIITVKSMGWPARPGLQQVKALALNLRAFFQCRRQMRSAPPDVLLAMGGYASFAPVMAARLFSVPIVLHEANVIPGKANRLLSRFANVFALGFDETRNNIAHRNMIYTGIPLRRRGTKETSTDWDVLKPDTFTILAMGGSRGARALNEIVAKAVISLHSTGNALQIIHLTGAEDEVSVRKAYHEAEVTHLVFAFLHEIDQAFQRASMAICRAGGSTCAELAKFGMASILIPYPHAASNHQMANARAMEKSGTADIIEENKCTFNRLADSIGGLMRNKQRLEKMRQSGLKRSDKDAALALADLVLEIGRGGTAD